MAKPLVGLLVPGGNLVIEREFRLMAPPEISIVAMPLLPRGAGRATTLREEVTRLEAGLPEAIRGLREARPDVLIYGCAAGSFVGGSAADARIADLVRRIGDLPLLTASRASRDALLRLGVRTVAVGTPYTRDMNDELAAYLREGGIRVTATESIPYERVQESDAVLGLTARLGRSRAEGIFLCCTALATVEGLEMFEKSAARPVVTSNQAAVWACMRFLHVAGRVEGYGSLLGGGW